MILDAAKRDGRGDDGAARESGASASAHPAGSEPIPRAIVAAVIDQAASRAGLAAQGDLVIAVAPRAYVERLRIAALHAVEEFRRDLCATEQGRTLADVARDELLEPADAWLMFLARPDGDDRARLVTVATAAAGLRTSARWCGLSARCFAGGLLVGGQLAEHVGAECGGWFARSELLALVALTPGGVSATIPPGQGAEPHAGVPVLWLGDGARIDARDADERQRASRGVPDSLRAVAEATPRVLFVDPTAHGAALALALESAGYIVEHASPDEIDARVAASGVDLLVASVDCAAARAALARLGGVLHEAPLPVLATTRYGHDDVRLTAARLGAQGLLRLPVRPFDAARKAHELVALRRMVHAERRHAEEARQAQAELVRSERMATLGWLAASVGHDLRTPLAAIRSNGELALKALDRLLSDGAAAALPPVVARTLKTLADLERTNLQAVARLAEIVTGLKGFSEAEAPSAAQASLAEIVQQVLILSAHELRHVHVRESVPGTLPAARVRFAEGMQVVMNLVVNAAHALPPGGTIEIAASATDDGHAVRLSVGDDGPGIDATVRDRLFRPGITTKAARGGTGLGLSIVKRIVDAAGGTIEVASQPGHGAVFHVTLPVAEPT